jgi:hypothetical protein
LQELLVGFELAKRLPAVTLSEVSGYERSMSALPKRLAPNRGKTRFDCLCEPSR